MKITFIGGGNMGEAMLSAVLGKNLSTPGDVFVSDISRERRQYLSNKHGINALADNRLAASKGEIVIMAIKPQTLAPVLSELKGQLNSSQLVLSIIAGARIDTLRIGLNHPAIVRVMPNTPAQIGEGMSVWTATSGVSGQQKQWASSILSAIGKEIYVDNEDYIDKATAVSGSGPAYLFLFIEAQVEAGVKIGLSRDMAQELVLQTISGSVHLLQKSGRSPADLRRMVTSPGGTTAEALAQFEAGGFFDLVARAVGAAYEKAKKLGGE